MCPLRHKMVFLDPGEAFVLVFRSVPDSSPGCNRISRQEPEYAAERNWEIVGCGKQLAGLRSYATIHRLNIVPEVRMEIDPQALPSTAVGNG